MHVKGLLVVVASTASLSLGLIGGQATNAYAAHGAPAAHANSSISSHSAGAGDPSINVDVKVFGSCGEFNGTLTIFTKVVGGNIETFFEVIGTLHARCGGTSDLTAHWTCDSFTPSKHGLGSTTGTKTINWISGECSFGISKAHVTLCWSAPGSFGCASSNSVSGIKQARTI